MEYINAFGDHYGDKDCFLNKENTYIINDFMTNLLLMIMKRLKSTLTILSWPPVTKNFESLSMATT